MKIIWKRRIHKSYSPEIWTELEYLEGNFIHKWHYEGWIKDEKIYSIIGTSIATFGKWEAYMGNETPRFNTLKEAKKYCEENNQF